MSSHSRGRPGWLHVGPLEERVVRAWPPQAFPPAPALLAIMTLAAVPQGLARRLAAHLTGGIVIGVGAVPDLPGFEHLRNVRLPVQAEATWEQSAGIYDPELRRIGVGSVKSPSASVCAHELGHAIDHMDDRPSQTSFWLVLHELNREMLLPPYNASREELWAECVACVLSRQARALVRLLGDEDAARRVYLWLQDRYGLG
ncbi:hypothetical protein ACIBHX_46505 [Nonomuraea sp. NPDC050536]|uniref:hypothetical protein n=1 Tax=Nonomuraea sp. NPDC050536 TaxID=3364366 RepID=UPI0037CB7FCC